MRKPKEVFYTDGLGFATGKIFKSLESLREYLGEENFSKLNSGTRLFITDINTGKDLGTHTEYFYEDSLGKNQFFLVQAGVEK